MTEPINKSAYLTALEVSLRTGEEQDFIRQFTNNTGISSKRHYLTNKLEQLVKDIRSEKTWKYNPLYAHQREAAESTYNYFSDNQNPARAYTVIPTGGGKTEIFAHITNSLAQEFRIGGTSTQKITPPTIILVPTEELVGQTVERLQKNFPNLQVGQYYSRKKEIRSTTVMVYNSFVEAVDQGFIKPDDLSLLVMDEAHRGLSDLRQDIFEQFKEKAPMLAYTATPAFGDDKNIEQLFGAETKSYSTTVRRLIDDGVLAPADNYIIHIDLKFTKKARPENEAALRRIIRVAKLKAALEFLLKHENPDTGEALLGHTTIGFNRYTSRTDDQSSAASSAAYFNKEIRKRINKDPLIRERVENYEQIAEYVGSSQADSNAIIQRVKNGETMAMFNVKYAREGTDIRRISNVLNIQGSHSLVDTLQGNGRALRTWEGNPSKRASIVDFYVTVNGEPMQDQRPLFFYEAVNDESIVKGIYTQPVYVDAQAAAEMLAEAKKMEQQDAAVSGQPEKRNTRRYDSGSDNFRNRASFSRMVLGSGTAAEKYQPFFDALYDRMEAHYADQPVHDAVPFYADGREIRVQPVGKGIPRRHEVHVSAVEPFRNEIGFPGRKTEEFLDETELRGSILGAGDVAAQYVGSFDHVMEQIRAHYERHKHLAVIPPFLLNGEKIPVIETVDRNGNLLMTVPRWSKRVLQEALGMPRDKTPRWKDKEQFERLVLGDAVNPAAHKAAFDALWNDMQRHHELQRQAGTQESFMLNGSAVHLAECRTREGQAEFCVAREGASTIRRTLDVMRIPWAISEQPLLGEVTFSASLDDIYRVDKKLSQSAKVFEPAPPDWISEKELRESGNYRFEKDPFNEFQTDKIRKIMEPRVAFAKPAMSEEEARESVASGIIGRYRDRQSGTIFWYVHPHYTREMEFKGYIQPKATDEWYRSYDLYELSKTYWLAFLGDASFLAEKDKEGGPKKLYDSEVERLKKEGLSEMDAAQKLKADGIVGKFYKGRHYTMLFGPKTMEHFASWFKDHPENNRWVSSAPEGYVSHKELARQYEIMHKDYDDTLMYSRLYYDFKKLKTAYSVEEKSDEETDKFMPLCYGKDYVGRFYSPEAIAELEAAGLIIKKQQAAGTDRFKASRVEPRLAPEARSIKPGSDDLRKDDVGRGAVKP